MHESVKWNQATDMITRKELDESLERVMNNVLMEIKLLRDHSDVQFGAIRRRYLAIYETRLDRQAGLIQSGAFVRYSVSTAGQTRPTTASPSFPIRSGPLKPDWCVSKAVRSLPHLK